MRLQNDACAGVDDGGLTFISSTDRSDGEVIGEQILEGDIVDEARLFGIAFDLLGDLGCGHVQIFVLTVDSQGGENCAEVGAVANQGSQRLRQQGERKPSS